MARPYVGRFAPSPTGPLHPGSLVAALASWLDARAHGGRWLLRIEDVDTPRCVPGADEVILGQLAICGLLPDEAPIYQSSRGAAYREALEHLGKLGVTYACGCTRRAIEEAMVQLGILHERFEERVYPGTCRGGLDGKQPRATRVLTVCGGTEAVISWTDRRLGKQHQNVAREVGDFVIHRADGLWAYQLAVIVDDGWQGITDVVRGEDLADNTARQIHLQRLLGLDVPRYLHTPLVLGADGRKLSKQNGASAFDASDPLGALQAAASTLGLPPIEAGDVSQWLAAAVPAWRARWVA
ncbi:tRNA glutamyl-Q(34) synthetase GluQRS [Aquincola sp. S2]|uniref:Glutamyl-Q tRNA(Asp) synthetase n=1 Tax=Pseudaquabacterium terrae TaxID=2732868 RepID=A0ABX2EH17_9BURK|nr:tRNA glutamyl-Q(34) synthetase GluQRS [Aquabacterium terrae]NRF67913.1 tRNA glutamyl-Q(34) synthetase GluQRS [Aquabacterium terrae]